MSRGTTFSVERNPVYGTGDLSSSEFGEADMVSFSRTPTTSGIGAPYGASNPPTTSGKSNWKNKLKPKRKSKWSFPGPKALEDDERKLILSETLPDNRDIAPIVVENYGMFEKSDKQEQGSISAAEESQPVELVVTADLDQMEEPTRSQLERVPEEADHSRNGDSDQTQFTTDTKGASRMKSGDGGLGKFVVPEHSKGVPVKLPVMEEFRIKDRQLKNRVKSDSSTTEEKNDFDQLHPLRLLNAKILAERRSQLRPIKIGPPHNDATASNTYKKSELRKDQEDNVTLLSQHVCPVRTEFDTPQAFSEEEEAAQASKNQRESDSMTHSHEPGTYEPLTTSAIDDVEELEVDTTQQNSDLPPKPANDQDETVDTVEKHVPLEVPGFVRERVQQTPSESATPSSVSLAVNEAHMEERAPPPLTTSLTYEAQPENKVMKYKDLSEEEVGLSIEDVEEVDTAEYSEVTNQQNPDSPPKPANEDEAVDKSVPLEVPGLKREKKKQTPSEPATPRGVSLTINEAFMEERARPPLTTSSTYEAQPDIIDKNKVKKHKYLSEEEVGLASQNKQSDPVPHLYEPDHRALYEPLATSAIDDVEVVDTTQESPDLPSKASNVQEEAVDTVDKSTPLEVHGPRVNRERMQQNPAEPAAPSKVIIDIEESASSPLTTCAAYNTDTTEYNKVTTNGNPDLPPEQASDEYELLKPTMIDEVDKDIDDNHTVPLIEEEHTNFDEHTKEAYREIFNGILEDRERPTDKCCKCCSQYCCVSLSCTCSSVCTLIGKKGDKVEQIKIATKALQKGMTRGWKMFGDLVTPLLHPICRDIIVLTEFFIGFIAFVLSCVSFGLGNNAFYNGFHLALALLSFVLATIDVTFSLRSFGICRRGVKAIIARRRQAQKDSERQGGHNDTDQSKTGSEQEKTDTSSQEEKKEKRIPPLLKRFWDISRILIAEAVLYPLTVCDIIELVVGKSYQFDTAEDGVSFFLFVFSSVSLFFYVYVVRLGVLAVLIYHLNKKRRLSKEQKKELAEKEQEKQNTKAQPDSAPPPKPNKDTKSEKTNDKESDNMDSKTATKGLMFQVFFFFHVLGQMVMQILMLTAITIKIAEDNRGKTLDEPLHISGPLWFLFFAGYIMPFAGILTFFIATYYWVYEYPNGICLNLLSILETPGIDTIIFPNDTTEEFKKKSEIIARLMDRTNFREDFKTLTERTFSTKLFYPFRSPVLVLICILYGAMQFAFVLVTIIGIQEENGGVIFYYFLSIILGLIANAYVFAIGALWVTIVTGVILLVALIVAAIVLVIVLAVCAGGSSSSKSQRN